MKCYFQGCNEDGVTREHIPPKAFFPLGDNNQLLTVRSCRKHNNAKSIDDTYVLAHICMNSSPNNRAREVWKSRLAKQLDYNNGAFRKMLTAGAQVLPDGSVRYQIDVQRLDAFFTALSCGIVFSACGESLPDHYRVSHIYHSLEYGDPLWKSMAEQNERFYSGCIPDLMEFGDVDAQNTKIYTVKMIGLKSFGSSITLVHEFYGAFKVTSMLFNDIASTPEVRSILASLD